MQELQFEERTHASSPLLTVQATAGLSSCRVNVHLLIYVRERLHWRLVTEKTVQLKTVEAQ